MKIILIMSLCFATSFVFADCAPCAKGLKIAESWLTANTKKKRMALSHDSYAILIKLEKLARQTEDPAVIPVIVKILGGMYLKQYDPLHDSLAIFNADLRLDRFRHAFDEEVGKLPADQRQPLVQGLANLPNRPSEDEDQEKIEKPPTSTAPPASPVEP
jgi:hypothetical protein